MKPFLKDVACLDFETLFASDYSLRSKGLNLSDYVRDERFLAHCVSIKLGREPARIYWYDEIRPAIEAVDWSEYHLLCHNTQFDGFILSQRYGVVPDTLYLDTLAMGRALHAGSSRADLNTLAQLYGLAGKNQNILGKMKGIKNIPLELRKEASEYCLGDVEKCSAIFERMLPVFPEQELRLIDWTTRAFCDPVLFIDQPRAAAELERELIYKAALVGKVGLDEDELQSAAKFAKRLEALGVRPPRKISKRTGLEAFAFSLADEEFIQLCVHENEAVRDLVAARLAAKSTIGETRARRFISFGSEPVPVGLAYASAHTLRWGGTNKVNWQNLEKEELDADGIVVPFTGELRKSIIAPQDYVICVADSAQIETRVTAYLAGQQDLLDLFANGGDPYCSLASDVYKQVVTKADRGKRAVGKAGILGLSFYMGAERFQGTLAAGLLGPKMLVDIEFAINVVQTYRKKNKKIVALWRNLQVLLYKMLVKANSLDSGYGRHSFPGLDVEFDGQSIWLPTGMGLHYPDLRAEWDEDRHQYRDYTYRSNNEFVRIHSGVLIENLAQRIARDIIAEQLLKINERYRVVLCVHDEIVALAPKGEADTCLKFMLETMAIPPVWMPDLPLKAEGGYAKNYSK